MTANGAPIGTTPTPASLPAGRAPREIALAARSDASILLTGRPDAARAFAYRLHLASGWRHGAFTVVDCTSGAPSMESVLFDAVFDERPSTAGIVQLRLVQAGTVLLQEINALPLAVQRRLAGRLSDQFTSIGAGRSRRRLMASTSEPLLERVLAGTFDDSLFYRLNVIHFGVASPD